MTGQPLAMRFTESATHTVTSPAIATNSQLGTLLTILTPMDVSNALRPAFGKFGGAQNVNVFKKGTDGTSLRLQVGRTSVSQEVDLPTGSLVVGRRVGVGFQWDIAGGSPTSYLGFDQSPMTAVTTGAANGSGTHSNANGSYRLGGASANTCGMIVWAYAVCLVRLTLWEMVEWHQRPSANLRACDVFWRVGMNGPTTVVDETGKQRTGTVSGPVVLSSMLPHTRIGRRPFGVAA